MLKQVH